MRTFDPAGPPDILPAYGGPRSKEAEVPSPSTEPASAALRRRELLAGMTAAAFLTATHGPLAWAAPADPGPSTADASRIGDGPHRIRKLRLVTAAALPEMKEFYCGLLGWKALEDSPRRLTLAAGTTALTFEPPSSDAKPDSEPKINPPFYHFAFNIPENKILAAREWQLRRTALVAPGENLRDPRYPDDVVHYRHWDAHSIFFWDPGGNFVEYIARHTLGNSAPGKFTVDDILYASEIAFVVADVPAEVARIGGALKLSTYRQSSDAFHALGDEHGLLLVMKQGRIMGFGKGPGLETWPVEAQIRGGEAKSLALPGYPFEIRADAAPPRSQPAA